LVIDIFLFNFYQLLVLSLLIISLTLLILYITYYVLLYCNKIYSGTNL